MQKNTLFNYFVKSPAAKRNADSQNEVSNSKKAKKALQDASPLANGKSASVKDSSLSSRGSTGTDGKENAVAQHKAGVNKKSTKICDKSLTRNEKVASDKVDMEQKLAKSDETHTIVGKRCAAKKRRRIIESEDEDISDEGDEYKPSNDEIKNEENCTSESEEVSEHFSSSDEASATEEDETPVKTNTGIKQKKPSTIGPPRQIAKLNQTRSKLLSFQNMDSQPAANEEKQNVYLHETLEFLFPKNVQDSDGHKPDHPDYNKSTLKVPSSFMTKQTPAMYQWWNIKSKHFDVVLFFKVGKFYELYHMDAVVGVKELGLIFMKGNHAHSGFPEVAFGRYSTALVQKGYTIARVEQTETPEQNAQRIKGKTLAKYEKTLRREVCRITARGTQMYSAWSGTNTRNHESNFLLALNERMIDHVDGMPNMCREFGVCFIDTSVGTFHLGQFYDDRYCSRFRTMIAHYYPCQILFEKGKLSTELQKIINNGLASVLQNGLVTGSQFWNAAKTLKTLSNQKYFVKDEEENWPSLLTEMKDDSLGLTAKSEYELTLSSLGACIYYLKKCLIDFEVISMKQFTMYECKEQQQVDVLKERPFQNINQMMILDSATLSNLEIIHNSKGTSEGSLLEKLNHCKTPFGKRLLRQWVCAPPCHPDIINARLDAIDDLMKNEDCVSSLLAVLTKMPDLERMLAHIHSLSKGMRNSDHPESRAILYEEKIYSKRKIEDFMCVLENYESTFNCLKKLQESVSSFNSTLLRRILGLQSDCVTGGSFPDMEKLLLHWKKAFDHKKAKETGKIIPNVGTNPEYDRAIQDLESVNRRAEKYLNEQKKVFSCSKIGYKGSGNKRFQLEIPNDVASSRHLSHDYEISGQRKGFKSFRTEETNALLKDIEQAESRRDAAQADSMSIIFREFSKDFTLWKTAVQFLGQVDVLISLSRFSKGADGVMCRPEVLLPDSDTPPMLQIEEARHPCVTKTIFSDDFIPNDTRLGCSGDSQDSETPKTTESICMLLTGPNMGGKSTLMRQVGLLVVLGQLGCHVPAQSCKFTSCDRIFTRLGASDRIMAGESTFFVELSETSSILKHATKNSLVLLDELGRGTSTYDGTAIASAVLQDIAENIGCRTIFSTHYRTLVDDVASLCNIQLGHMACMVEDGDDAVEEVLTFLYKLASGACPKSYGFHAASLASVSEEVVKLARIKAAELERNKSNMAAFRDLFYKEFSEVESFMAVN